MRNYEMVLMALKSGETKTATDLKAELPGLEWWNMHKYVARAKYLAGAEIELMKAGKPLKAARARDAETLRLVNADKFKAWSPVTKTGGPLFRKANPKAKTQKAKVKAAKPKTKTKIPPAIQAKLNAQHAKSNSLIAAAVAKDPWLGRRARVTPEATNLVNPVATPDQPGHGEVKGANVVDMIKAELAATAPKGTKKAAALPRGPKATPAPAPVKVERVSNELTPLSDDPLDIPDFLRIKSTKTEE
jgi:hypothetical protein